MSLWAIVFPFVEYLGTDDSRRWPSLASYTTTVRATGSLPLSASFFINTVFPIATGYGWWFNTSDAGLILLLPYISEGLRVCSRSEHKFLSVSLSFAFGLFRYLPFVSFPAEGMLIDLIVLAIGVCYLR